MFNLPAPKREEASFEDMIILRLDDYLIGVIVDSIDKVVGINSESIQPPHPIFGDINIKFIKGVVENEGRLYLIFDVEKILGDTRRDEDASAQPKLVKQPVREPEAEQNHAEKTGETDYAFVVETLQTFRGFHVTEHNRNWVRSRFEEWQQQRTKEGAEVQLQEAEDADLFLQPFYSPYSGGFWGNDYCSAVKEIFKQLQVQGNVMVWNPGCGAGYETYSLTIILRESFPNSQLKVWAHDNDLLNISTAPNLIFSSADLAQEFEDYTVEGKNGLQFNKEIRDAIFFEFHNVLHSNPFPEVDMIVARDILSFQKQDEQDRLVQEFAEKLKPGGILILGRHEELVSDMFEDVSNAMVRAYKKR
jgi:purine-binding chemotaxis protein CheW